MRCQPWLGDGLRTMELPDKGMKQGRKRPRRLIGKDEERVAWSVCNERTRSNASVREDEVGIAG
jgi:hypothetical protein